MYGVKRGLQFLILGLVLFALYYLLLRNGTGIDYDSISPEELNSLIQNKNQDVQLLKKTELQYQSLTIPYLKEANSLKVTNWEIHGKAMVKNNKCVRLTRDVKHQASNMFASRPIEAESFEMELTFSISTPNARGLLGDGLAIWFLDTKPDIGDVFGVPNYFNGLGIMIDTYKNGKRGTFPYVNIMLGDGTTKYSKSTDGYDTRLAGCPLKKLVNPPTGETKMRLVYLKNGYLSIDFNLNGVHEDWTNCVALTDVHLPDVKYLGLSAETGELTQQNDIIENRIYGLLKPDGTYINSLLELEALAVKKDLQQEQKTHKNRERKGYGRKSLARLQRAEQRIKERDRKRRLEKYGDEDATFVVRNFRRVITFIKYLMCLVVGVLVLWGMFIIYRMQRQNKKSRVVGLLD